MRYIHTITLPLVPHSHFSYRIITLYDNARILQENLITNKNAVVFRLDSLGTELTKSYYFDMGIMLG